MSYLYSSEFSLEFNLLPDRSQEESNKIKEFIDIRDSSLLFCISYEYIIRKRNRENI